LTSTTNCETIYIVMRSREHLIPSYARNLSVRLRTLAASQKRIVLIGSAISKDVVSMLKHAFPDLQVMQV